MIAGGGLRFREAGLAGPSRRDGKKLGKASVTGYCIRFKALKDINIDTLEAAIRYGLAAQESREGP